MELQRANLWMPITKSPDGKLSAIISDTSIDKDDEMMDVSLLRKWCSDPNKFLPMQKDHEWTIDNMIGHWKNPQLVASMDGNNHALVMEPVFYRGIKSADEVILRINQGANIGLSIGALPTAHKTIEKDGQKYKVWTDATLLEVSVTPIPSNNHTYMHMAKSFNLKSPQRDGTGPDGNGPQTGRGLGPCDNNPSEQSGEKKQLKHIGDKMTEETNEKNEVLDAIKSLTGKFEVLQKDVEELKKPEPEPEPAPEPEKEPEKEDKAVDRVGVLKAQASLPVAPSMPEVIEKSEYGLDDMLLASIGRTDLIR